MSNKEVMDDSPDSKTEPCACDVCTKGILSLLDGRQLAALVRDGDRLLRRR